ncbi:nucleotidyltransferase domain-containing protein [Flavivirga spongiicola]|uniref:Nucleotidyltransferase domain-containing protein n=1 Tax=Flavivirga spongiicola TaxID=421621 RepID=A0ABU7XPL1_9FLAO|nr:nucleotidyltransferase domain-containing protein [Flavivirga sp. MEBiC05379]MDO5977695.1 nucleotidyltransferase domain-containing protein [Flavivirga sp. MEBiC05379]
MDTLKTLLYFSIFKYPLTEEEIYKFSRLTSKELMHEEIDFLLQKSIIYKFDGFYSTINDIATVHRRTEGNRMAKNIMPKAFRVAKLITQFPYVEGVSLSGALSKGYYDNDGDIDFFIITKPNRLWIARTLLILYKKIFLLNSKKYFCVNYFISSSNLEIFEQNRFTATEAITLIPVSGKAVYTSFIKENPWTKDYFPNIGPFDSSTINDYKKAWLSLLLQRILNTKIGDFLDNFFRKITLKKWHSKFGHLEKDDFEIAMKSTKNISKHHPQNFQKKVIDLLNEKYDTIRKLYNLDLHSEHA